VEVGSEQRAYPLRVLEAVGGVVNDTLGETPIVVLFEPESGAAGAYRGTLGGRVLKFAPVRKAEGVARDSATGSQWRVDGRAATGALRGEQLDSVKFHKSAWYAWAAYFPNTSIFQPKQ